MTERALPAVGVGVRARPAAGGYAGPIAAPRVEVDVPAVTVRREAVLSTPARAGMLLGATAAIYAVTLAGVSTLQVESDAAVSAGRAPYLDAVARSRAANDALDARIQAADAQARALVASYGAVGPDVTAFEARLDALAVLVADVEGRAAALPARIQLPSVTVRSAGTRSSAPRTVAKTKASGH